MKSEKTWAMGSAFGAAAGSVVGVLTDNVALWISLGVAMGAGIAMTVILPDKIAMPPFLKALQD